MEQLYWIMILGITLYQMITKQVIELDSIALLLVMLIVLVSYLKLFQNRWIIFLGMALSFPAIVIDDALILMVGIWPYFIMRDHVMAKQVFSPWDYGLSLGYIVLIITIHSDKITGYEVVIWLLGLIIGYMIHWYGYREKVYLESLDKERRLRYENEQIKNKLIQATEEVEKLSELKERNRIARDIHDHVGHGIAGVLFQLQAANKVLEKDKDKGSLLVEDSIQRLQKTLEMTRETVHKMEVTERTGVDLINLIIDPFEYCAIEKHFIGDFNLVAPTRMSLLTSATKELLTNVTKYSGASKVWIDININDLYIRFSMRDNGKGSQPVQMGMGLRGLQERVKNVGGTCVINGTKGFEVILNIPNS